MTKIGDEPGFCIWISTISILKDHNTSSQDVKIHESMKLFIKFLAFNGSNVFKPSSV